MAAMLTSENKGKIAANRSAIFELEGQVTHNKAKAYMCRSVVAENASLIAKNYNAAFLGNRQLANENTDALFRNRVALFSCLPATTEVEINYREASLNAAKLAFLEHRANINEQVLSISNDMAALNADSISINKRIMEANEEVKEYNKAMIAENTRLINAAPAAPTPESNAALISANAAKIAAIKSKAGTNSGAIDALLATTDANRAAAIANSELIAQRRLEIVANHEAIAANRASVGARLAAK